MSKDILCLGIESSCDETSVAVVKNGREVLSNVIATSKLLHQNKNIGCSIIPKIDYHFKIEPMSV